jgi:hypothetical protein
MPTKLKAFSNCCFAAAVVVRVGGRKGGLAGFS